MTSTQDDAELLKDLRGMGKPPLFNGNDTDVSFFPVSEDDSILLRRADDVVDASPDEHHRAIREMDNQMNQHIEMPQIQYTGKFADKVCCGTATSFAENHRDQGTRVHWGSGQQVSVG